MNNLENKTNTELVQSILENIKKLGEVDYLAICDINGLPLTDGIGISSDASIKKIAAFSNKIFKDAQKCDTVLKIGAINMVIVDTENRNKLILFSTGKKAILIASITSKADFGLILLKIKEAAKKIEEILG